MNTRARDKKRRVTKRKVRQPGREPHTHGFAGRPRAGPPSADLNLEITPFAWGRFMANGIFPVAKTAPKKKGLNALRPRRQIMVEDETVLALLESLVMFPSQSGSAI
jgi:hypothetical protein